MSACHRQMFIVVSAHVVAVRVEQDEDDKRMTRMLSSEFSKSILS